MKRLAFLAAVACLCGCALPGTGRAGPITYTETATGSGSLGGTSFTDATVTITGTGDTANIRDSVPGFFNNSPITATVTVAGIGTATFTGTIIVHDNQPTSLVAFSDETAGADILGTSGSPFDTYDLKTAVGPVSGPADEVGFGRDLATTDGAFVLNSVVNDTATFTATPTPEPASLTLLGLGAAGLLGYGWRRKRSA
jgi:hypothetical protein